MKYNNTKIHIQDIYMNILIYLGPVANLLSEMFSYRLVVMSGGFILGVGYFCSSFVPHMELMFLTYGIIGGELKLVVELTFHASLNFRLNRFQIVCFGSTFPTLNIYPM